MGLHWTRVYILVALCAPLSTAAPVTDNLALSVLSPLSTRISSTATLPCWLNPPQNVEDLEVRWYRGDNFDNPALLYKDRVLDTSKDAKYSGRVSFGQKSSSSGGLQAGDVSLQLVNITIEDAGDYTCYISSDQGYDKGSITLYVIETGTSPLLSVEWTQGSNVNVSCESTGWYPEPQLRWSDQKKDLKPNHLNYSNNPSGLVSVHSWILRPSSSEVSCSVSPADGEKKESGVHLGKPVKHEGSGSAVGGWVAFALLLLAILAVVGLLYYKKRDLFFGKKDKSQNDRVDEKDLKEPLLKDVPPGFTEAVKHYVNVTLDNQRNPYIKMVGCIVRDAITDFPDGSNVTHLTAVRGQTGFTSGQHYWEVNLHKDNIGTKESWWLGVTTATNFHKHPDIPPTMSNGFWFLSSSPGESLQFNTETKVFLPVLPRPQMVGVYLDYDKGELSFYNVEAKSLIGSLNVKFTGEVFPLFNPCRGDQAPMKIIQKQEESEDGNKVNSGEPTE